MKSLLLVLMMLFSFSAVAEKNEKTIRELIAQLVKQRHPEVPDGFWESLGAESLPVLKKMYLESKSAQEQSFLVDGMAHFNDVETGTFLESAVESTPNDVMKKKLLGAVIRSEGERAFDFVEPYLKSGDPHIRTVVAKGLVPFAGNERIKRSLEEFKAKEKKPWILKELAKTESGTGSALLDQQKVSQHSKAVEPGSSPAKSLEPLDEKSWAGSWRGSLVTENKVILADLTLTAADATKSPIRWKVEIKLPKQAKQEWKPEDYSVHSFQTKQAHWIEVRNLKQDAVFLSLRKAKQ